MRIISGNLRGRKLSGYDIEGTRPTMDKVKESMFAMIQFEIPNSVTLDLFAGSGSLGLEAISNGAKHCYFVDRNFKCTQIIAKDVQTFGIQDKATILTMTYQKALIFFKDKNVQFDLVFLDPPYKDLVIADSIQSMKKLNLLKPGALIVCEMEQNYEQINDDDFKLQKTRQYGHKTVLIYQYYQNNMSKNIS